MELLLQLVRVEIRVQLHVLCIQLDKETSRATSAAVSSSSRTSQPLLTMPSVVDVDDAHTSLSALNSSSEYAKDEDVPLEERILCSFHAKHQAL